MRLLQLAILIAGLLVSLFILSVAAFFSACSAFDCLGSGQLSPAGVLFAIPLFVIFAFLPALSLRLLYAHIRRKPLQTLGWRVSWLLVLAVTTLGLFQISVDPGDAIWPGLPLLAYAFFVAISLSTADILILPH